MQFISYAQNFEDIMLWRALKDIPQGFYIDVGAYDPCLHSVTKAFYDHGWHGINIEPIEKYYKNICDHRPRDINLSCAAGSEISEMTFYEIPETGLSTLSKSVAKEHAEKHGYKKIKWQIPVRTITDICQQYKVSTIHFLKIDVEGAEDQVLKGIDFSLIRPWILVIEATYPLSSKVNYTDWETGVLQNDYQFVYFDGLNRFYIADEHIHLREYFNTPPSVFDNFMMYSLVEAQNKIKMLENELKRKNRIEQLVKR